MNYFTSYFMMYNVAIKRSKSTHYSLISIGLDSSDLCFIQEARGSIPVVSIRCQLQCKAVLVHRVLVPSNS